jgi:hypothetical protein
MRKNVKKENGMHTIEGEYGVVWAVPDLRRDPAWIREKLKE